MTKQSFLLNAFSLQMIKDFPCNVVINEVSELPNGLTSAIGHADTAAVLGVEMNRINVQLGVGDVAYVAQLQGGRLPEGSTTLPDGFSFKYLKVEIETAKDNNVPDERIFRDAVELLADYDNLICVTDLDIEIDGNSLDFVELTENWDGTPRITFYSGAAEYDEDERIDTDDMEDITPDDKNRFYNILNTILWDF